MWSSDEWVDYFGQNDRRRMAIPWSRGVVLTADERDAIAASLREFQLGESGEGRHFRACAARWASRSGDTAYPAALAMFIAEEQRHARELGRVMDLAGIPRAQRLAVDTVFRHLRKLAGLELSIRVLVTAELVAQVYYRCLLNATACPVLRGVCRQILRDEVQHIRFQCQRLAMIRTGRSRVMTAMRTAAHVGLLLVTSAVIWRKHGGVFRRGGLGYCGTVQALWQKMAVARTLMRPPSPATVAACNRPAPPIKPTPR